MKVRMTFKTPDVMEDAIREAVEVELMRLYQEECLDEDEEDLMDEAKLACQKFVEYGEYGECITVEVDTDKGTCVVVPVSGVMEPMIPLSDILKAVDDQPEYPGDMPASMQEKMAGDIHAVVEALRATVRLTKKAIRQRLEKLV